MTWTSTYASRFNARTTLRRPARPLTDAEFEAWVSTTPEWAQGMHRFVRQLGQMRAPTPAGRAALAETLETPDG